MLKRKSEELKEILTRRRKSRFVAHHVVFSSLQIFRGGSNPIENVNVRAVVGKVLLKVEDVTSCHAHALLFGSCLNVSPREVIVDIIANPHKPPEVH